MKTLGTVFEGAQTAVQTLDQAIKDLTEFRDSAAIQIAQYLRVDQGIELDPEAIRATLTRPYTLLPINEHEAWLIHWRGVRMPIFGWVVAQEPAFIKARVTRSMDLLTPLPGWMKQELGWKPPEHKAVIDGTRTSLKLTEGDDATFKRKYGQHLGGKQADGTFKIKGGDAWIRLVAALVRDGILPYAPTPVADENWQLGTIPDTLKEIIHKKEKEAGAPYIQRAVEEFVQKGAVLINYPPGSGKTLTTCVILNHFRGRVLLLADTTMLIDQWRDRLKKFAPNADVTLSTYQGAQKYLQEEWDLIVPDECFPAGTLVDGRPIETLAVGDTITTYDEQMFQFTRARITRVFKRPAPQTLVRICAGESQVVCTLDHPILTQRGWVKAQDLTAEDVVIIHQEYSYGTEKDQTNRTDLQLVPPAFHHDRKEPSGLLEGEGEGVLLAGALGRRAQPGIVDSHIEHEHRTTQGALSQYAEKQPNAKAERARTGLLHLEGHRMEAGGAGREWTRLDGTSETIGQCVEMANGIRDPHRRYDGAVPSFLQGGYGEPSVYGGHRSGRELAPAERTQATGPQERGLSYWARVDCVEILQSGDPERFGQVCPDGYVYNLEVEDHHTYIANRVVVHNCQRLPANTFSRLAFIKTKYRLGLTGTAWREDDRQHLIVALSGFPVAIRWAEMIQSGVLRRPRIVVATVPNEAAKTPYVKSLVARRRGRALIFCDWLKQGQQLADALDVPFIHGATPRKLQKLEESDVCVVSRIGDRGISLTDLRLVIEVAGAGASREQLAQRVGRLLHGEFEGEFVTVFTPEEAAKYRGRIFGVEAELAGEVDIEFIQVGNVSMETARPERAMVRRAPRTSPVPAAREEKPKDEIARTLALPAVAAKVTLAKKGIGGRTAPYIERVIRYCWDAALSPKEMAEGLGITDDATRSRMSSACNAAAKVGLMAVDGDGRYRVSQDEINRLKALSGLRNS